MENYICTIPDSNISITDIGFTLPYNKIISNAKNWKEVLTKHAEFKV